MKKLIVLLLALTLLTSFVAPAMARRPDRTTVDGETCNAELGCGFNPPVGCNLPHARGHPMCAMPHIEGGVPKGPPEAIPGLPPNDAAQCLRLCIAGPHD